MSSTAADDQQQPQDQQHPQASLSSGDATHQGPGVASTSAAGATATSKRHSQHPISQLPLATRKKLSRFRAKIKRQASRAARLYNGSSTSTESPGAYSNTGENNNNSNSNNKNTNAANMGQSPGPSGNSGRQLVGQHSLAAPGRHGQHHHHQSLHSKNFKQKIIALMKKFRTDGGDFDEQYRAALERELLAVGRDSTAIDELLEQGLDVEEGEEEEEEEEGSESSLDWDDISESSVPKPSLRPYFSSTTLDNV